MDFSGLIDLASMPDKVNSERLFIGLGGIEYTPVSNNKLINSLKLSF